MTTPVASPAGRRRLLTGPLVRVLGASFGALSSFYLLLSVVPMLAAAHGVAGAAGPVTGLLMFGGVAAELGATRLAARYGHRRILVAGLLLLGAPALVPIAADRIGVIVAVCAVRGFGFGLAVVAGGTLVVGLLPAERRGEGLGLFGIVTCVPAILALPAGVWLAGHIGYPAVFAAASVVALGALLLRPGRGAAEAVAAAGAEAGAGAPSGGSGDRGEAIGLVEGLRRPEQHRLAGVFAATTMAAGVVVAFLPLAAANSQSAAIGLLAQAATAALGRWTAGRYGDRRGHTRLLLPGLLVAAAGIGALVRADRPVPLLLGATLFGAGFGVVQSATLAAMLQRVPPAGYGMVNAAWNLAYDLGYGAGPIGFGLLVSHTGYGAAFAATAGLLLVAALPAAYHQPRRAHRIRPARPVLAAATAGHAGAGC
jgi:MFS family permease